MKKGHIDTEHYVTDKQLSKNMAIEDPFINRKVSLPNLLKTIIFMFTMNVPRDIYKTNIRFL